MMNDSNKLFCCQNFQNNVFSNNLETHYRAKFRQYGILLRGHDAIQLMFFCPWCGQKLPGTLQDAWEKELLTLGFAIEAIQGLDDSIFPNKYCTDQWWLEKIHNGELLEEDEDISLQIKFGGNTDFCCNLMNVQIKDRNPYICYLPYVREYGIAKKHCVDEMELIHYCPWCGKKLPESLRTEWNRQRWNPARRDISVNDPYDEEFLTDRWWKIREEN